jgi:thioredoxin-like negative regulator of GroEL
MRSEKERELNFKTNFLARTIAVPLDNLFLGLGARIEKDRRARGVYPPVEIHTPSNEDSQRCFSEYMADAQQRMQKGQLRPGEDVRVIDNRVQVSGQVAVMAINALLAKVIFDKNPTNEFFVEESFPLDWMYPHLTPFGIIMKINREKLPELTQDIVDKDHNFWSDYSERLIGNWITYDTPVSNITQFAERVYVNKNYKGFKGDPRFVRDEDGQKAFSKLRSSIAGVYAWRVNETAGRAMMLEQRPPNTLTPEDKRLLEVHQRMFREAEFAFKQAYAFCPYSPEALYRYVQLLAGARRFDDAILLAQTSQKLDPSNLGLENLENELKRLKTQAGGGMPTAAADPALPRLEAAYRTNPRELSNALSLAQAYASMGRTADVLRIADDLVANPQSDKANISFAAQIYQQLGNYPKLETALERWAKMEQSPEAWLDYAAAQAVQNRQQEAIVTLQQALALNRTRLATNPKAGNIAPTIAGDARFASLKANPAFQQMLATNK